MNYMVLVITLVGVATLCCCAVLMWNVVNSGDIERMAGMVIPTLIVSVVGTTIGCFGLCMQDKENKKCKGDP